MLPADAGAYELEPLAGEPEETVLRRNCAQVEDLFWSGNYWKEAYFRTWNEAREAVRAAWQRADVAAAHGLAWSVGHLLGRVTQQARTA